MPVFMSDVCCEQSWSDDELLLLLQPLHSSVAGGDQSCLEEIGKVDRRTG